MNAIAPALDVLLVEDNPGDALLAEEAIGRMRPVAGIRQAGDVDAALVAIGATMPDVILLDLGLPDSSGLDGVDVLCRSLPLRPIIVLTGHDDPDLALSALERGAQDYLVKGEYTPEILGRAIRYAVERKRSERELLHAARYDAVTGLANRAYFTGLLGHALDRARRAPHHVHLLFLDLDHFKNVNDTLGHAAGDTLLRDVGARLTEAVRASDIVARLGGDEFVVMIEGTDGPASAMAVADKILERMRPPFAIDGVDVSVTPSIGIASYPSAGEDADTLLKHADTAMYRAKARGRNTVECFTDEMNLAVRELFDLEMALRQAVPERDFELYYQPIVDCVDGRITGAEALLRWRRPGRPGLQAPDTFLPLLERSSMIRDVGYWILERACRDASRWPQTNDAPQRLSVNVSPRQLEALDFVDRVAEILERTGMAPERLVLEITERVLLKSREENTRQLKRLRAMGIGVAIDDFGSGYSSLSYLTAFPFDTVKIDRSFIERVTSDPDHALLAAGMLGIARSLGRRIVVEGVETAAQLEFLREHECREVQGWLFSEALPVLAYERLQRSSRGRLRHASPAQRRP